MRAFEWGFEPDSIELRRGEEVRIELRNDGEILHDLKINDLEAEKVDARGSGPLEGEEGELFVGVEAGEDGTLSFVPQEAGTFEFYCSIRGHRQLDMEGELTVR